MKLDFIIVSLPRSGTTWCAEWTTTEHSICWHDATGYMLPSELETRQSSKKYRGISCTGAWMWKDWFESHPANKLILERDYNEINASLIELGMNPLGDTEFSAFEALKGPRIHFTELFTNPEPIWKHLLPGLPFDAERHAELVKMNIQPIDRVQVPDADYIRRAMADLQAQLGNN